jgi:serine/threonine protein kinase
VTTNIHDRIGIEIADGRYKILGRIGEGSMGQVFRAFDRHLETDVVIKFPVAPEEADERNDAFLERFGREIRSLVRLSHPHIVKVIDVGDHRGQPYVVMQYLAGGSLKARIESGPGGQRRAMRPESLADWLPDVARALDFVHDQQHIHRDVKPANILFDQHGNAFLGDFGVIKALSGEDWGRSALTAPGFLLGTPNYVAPEIVMGRPFDGRVDQYALAMTVHEVLTGANCMVGPTPSATMVNQTKLVPPDLAELIPGVPRRLCDAVLRGLAKEPKERFESCMELAVEILSELPSPSASSTATLPTAHFMPHASSSSGSQRQTTVLPSGSSSIPTLYGPEHKPGASSSSLTLPPPRSGDFATPGPATPPPPPRFTRRRLAAGVFGLLLALGAFALWRGLSNRSPEGPRTGGLGNSQASSVATPVPAEAPPIEIHIAYGTEKQKWLEAAAEEFHKTAEGQRIKIHLDGMGSLEGAKAVLNGPKPIPIHVWSPASSTYRNLFERDWRVKEGSNPISKAENLALTPMVFVMWKNRYEAFIKKYGKVGFQTIAQAMREPGGWGTIADHPEWGFFKFAHTHPDKSNSGLLTLVLMAYEYSKKERGLTLADITQPGFQKWLQEFEQGVARPSGSLTHSTGTLMREMVQRGPSQYDCLMLYENLVIDYFEAARDHWGDLHVVYAEPNIWNDHPYYILDVPWSSAEQRVAAAEFLKFLMSEPIQRRALEHGFRPGNPDVPVRFPTSPLVRHEAEGVKLDLPRMCEPPQADVVNDLLASFRRIER